ncbi:MAG: response regulator, partial [Planctomycetales bacterium]|nr:response regulator [Planctomycetales bacterium]
MSKVMIVDDHPVTRDGLATRIAIESDLEVCGEAADVPEAIQVIDATQPDIAVVDISLETG